MPKIHCTQAGVDASEIAPRKILARTHCGPIARETIALAIDDIITVGATPVSAYASWAAGGST